MIRPHTQTSHKVFYKAIFGEPGVQYEYFHTPGYPAFAAAILFITGGSFFAVTFVQILLVFCIALMTLVLGRSSLVHR